MPELPEGRTGCRLPLDLLERFLDRPCPLVWAIVGDRIENIDNRNNPSGHRDVFTCQAVWACRQTQFWTGRLSFPPGRPKRAGSKYSWLVGGARWELAAPHRCWTRWR